MVYQQVFRYRSKIDQFQFKHTATRQVLKTRSCVFLKSLFFLFFRRPSKAKRAPLVFCSTIANLYPKRIYHHLFNHVSPLSVHHPSIWTKRCYQRFSIFCQFQQKMPLFLNVSKEYQALHLDKRALYAIKPILYHCIFSPFTKRV